MIQIIIGVIIAIFLSKLIGDFTSPRTKKIVSDFFFVVFAVMGIAAIFSAVMLMIILTKHHY